MAKQVIIAAMEEVFGEYIQNISKENLKIAALSGKIALHNVQLDGGLIGDHVMGAFGLSGFGVLSCSARSIHISVPWKNLEKEPTKFEVRGVHMVCVPLTPSTANNLYGTGTRIDPRCTLRTRTKRMLLARLERNFWNGQIPGEGPPMKRIQRAVRDVEKDLRRSRGQRRHQRSEEDEMDEAFDKIVFGLNDGSTASGERSLRDASYSADSLPELPRDWKVKLREKVLRNMEASMFDVHIRCEVPEGGLGLSIDRSPESPIPTAFAAADERAFSLGFMLESLVVRTANEQWEVGSHDKRNSVNGSTMSSVQGHLGPNGYVVRNNKIGYFKNFSIYWDDEPPLLLAKTDVLQGNFRKLTTDKLLKRIASALDQMVDRQEPGKAVRQSLAQPVPVDLDLERQHEFVCRSLAAEVRVRMSDRTRPGPISCSADVLPFDFAFNIRPHQYLQYQRLKNAILCQQRFDTMLHHRPLEDPKTNPRAWWKYAIACVTSRPNSRPWEHVKVIAQNRNRYIELVVKKYKKSSDSNGFHGGLSDKDSAELLALEDLLPLEALEAFHLLALRSVHEQSQRPSAASVDNISGSGSEDTPSTPSRSRGRFRLLGSSGRRRMTTYSELDEHASRQSSFRGHESLGRSEGPSTNSISLLEAMTLRLGKKVWYIYWKLHDAALNVVFLDASGSRSLAYASLRASGNIRAFGRGKRDFFFDVSHCDVFHRDHRVLFFQPHRDGVAFRVDEEWDEADSTEGDVTVASTLSGQSQGQCGPDMYTASRYLELPPADAACRVAAGKDNDAFKLSISAHPATLIWTTSFFDSLSEFFNIPAADVQDMTQHIRNAATPLARKAQMALLSPASMSLHLNIAAPKVWVPISSTSAEGSLFLDVGLIKVSGIKDEGETDMNWDVLAGDIQMNFVRGRNTHLGDDLQVHFLAQLAESVGRNETTIIRPFHVSVDARNRVLVESDGCFVKPGRPPLTGLLVRRIEVVVSPISLNLVDAEVLARAIGKWYSRGVHRVRHRVSLTSSRPQVNADEIESTLSPREVVDTVEPVVESSMPCVLSLIADKLEIALEGHSKTSFVADDRSLASQDSFHEVAPPTRTYVLDVWDIVVRRSHVEELSTTQLSVSDASVNRLREGASYRPLERGSRDFTEPQYCILVRALHETTSSHDDTPKSELLKATLLHDRRAHLDEVEVDVDSVILRVTPTTLKDCAKAFRRVVEFMGLITKEMERLVHEEGRKARQRVRVAHEPVLLLNESPDDSGDRPGSPSVSETLTELAVPNQQNPAYDSSILFRVTLKESTLLAGRPTAAIEKCPFQRDRGVSFAVVQLLSNALVMFQSIENPDASGTKTLHISVDNVSSLVNTEFERVSPEQAPPMIGPTGAEFRIVYATENFGCVVSQDVSLDFEAVKACMTPNDLSIFVNICKKMFERMKAFGQIPRAAEGSMAQRRRVGTLSSIVRYQKSGTGIATRVRAEVQSFSFILLRAFKSILGAPEFLDFNIKDMKGRLEGCISALSGECSAALAVHFFNRDVSEWEYAMEPSPFLLAIDQMPNELVLNLSSDKATHFNLSGMLLRDLAEMKFDILQDGRFARNSTEQPRDTSILTPTALSTVGLRRATEARSVKFYNQSGFDVHIAAGQTVSEGDSGLIRNNASKALEIPGTGSEDHESLRLSIRVAESAGQEIGEREPVFDLPVAQGSDRALIFFLRPLAIHDVANGHRSTLSKLIEGRTSPETIMTEATNSDPAYLSAEPVVEWCMHNQRLKSSVADVFSLDKGRDILSSVVWSPEDELYDDFDGLGAVSSTQELPETESTALATLSPSRAARSLSSHSKLKSTSIWLRPYLKNDSPEWTDMTCSLRMARERVMLPDSNWIWVNEWTVDLSGDLGVSTDADGWEYEADFETFTRTRRAYQRGDSCRRRRWTRTRIVKPPRLDDPYRQLKLAWESTRDENGNFSIVLRSHVRVKNHSGEAVGFFVSSPTWDDEVFVGSAAHEEDLCIPVNLASAVYMRVSKPVASRNPKTIRDCIVSEKFVILPTSHTSSNYTRVKMQLDDVSSTTLHYLIQVRGSHGLVDIIVEPVLRVVNLLPCQLECQLGEVLPPDDNTRSADSRPILGFTDYKKIARCETLTIGSGKEGACTATSPWRKPHISFRVPGCHWSPWQRIVNRKANSNTWRPHDKEEDWHFSSKGDADFAEELKTIVRFSRYGSEGLALSVVLSIDSAHCPTLRVYSQYWIVDKTGFGCRFSDGFADLMGTTPDAETACRSYLPAAETKDPGIRRDMSLIGHQWSIGMSGMTLFFSARERLTLSIETGIQDRKGSRTSSKIKSKWVSPLDISNVVPKTVFSVDELNGPRRFDLAISVTVCPGVFGRTKLITLLPKYQIVNLLHRELVVAQDGCLEAETLIPSQSAVPFHWERGALLPKVKIGAPSGNEKSSGTYACWTNGSFRVDRVGITSLRLPTDSQITKIPLVVQAEVRLATKDQSSAIVIVIWAANQNTNPLYILRNRTTFTILCRQPLRDDKQAQGDSEGSLMNLEACAPQSNTATGFDCSTDDIGPMIKSFFGLEKPEEYVWALKTDDVVCFGFDDPEKPHVLEWTCVNRNGAGFDEKATTARIEVDAMGSTSVLCMGGRRRVRCQIKAEHSTKVIEFLDVGRSESSYPPLDPLKTRIQKYQECVSIEVGVDGLELVEEDEDPAFSVRVDVPGLYVSVVDNVDAKAFGREIMLARLDKIHGAFSQTREGYHEFEFRLTSLQVDNHVHKSIHPVMVFCPRVDETEPLLHMSAVRRLQEHNNTYVFRYAAIRLLELEICLDRRTAECIARFIEPMLSNRIEESDDDHPDWVSRLTNSMGRKFARPDRHAPREIEKLIHTANSGRIYFEQLHLHPVRLGLTFTQEWMEWNPGAETMMLFQFIRGMASIAKAPLVFTSFVVGHVFEAPQALGRVIATHYSSQLTKQVFGILGSLAILGAPADFISNVGSGVRDFFYEPIQGAVHGPRQFIEGLEAGTQSLARGVFVGVVRGAANVTDVVNSNLAGLTADDEFIDERKAHQRMLTDAMSRGASHRTFGESLLLASASVTRGIRSGALGIVEQPAHYASKHGPVGFVKGVGKAMIGAVVKPVVGLGDAAVLVMNHLSDATSKNQVLPKIPKRLRRALPCRSVEQPNCVRLEPYDERAAKAQKIVTGGDSVDDVYLGHINIPSHLVIASEQCLWAIDKRSRDPWCVSWDEISHIGLFEKGVPVVVFSQTGLKTYVFDVESKEEAAKLHALLSMQTKKMGNSSDLNNAILNTEPDSLSRHQIPGVRAPQVNHVFGSCNLSRLRLSSSVKDEIDLVEQCFGRVRVMGSDSSSFFKTLDHEAWSLVSAWGQVFSGLNSRRCIVASVINGTGSAIQIKSTKLMEGGSPCYSIPTKEFDQEQGVLHPGGVIIFFGWGVVPNLLQAGNVFMHIETSGFIGNFADHKSRETFAEAMPGYQIGFLEKSYDESGWWAKFWLLVRAKH